MKVNCEIVQDLLPLYEDGMCSVSSRAAVEEHLKTCPDCRGQAEGVRKIVDVEIPEDIPGEDRAVVRGLRKIRRRWYVSLIAMLLVVPMVLLSVNQVRGDGVCFTNLDDIARAAVYVGALEDGDFLRAADQMDSGKLYKEVQEILAWTPEDYVTRYEPVTIGDARWVATGVMYDEFFTESVDARDFWRQMMYNGISGVMIPEEYWQEISRLESGVVGQTEDGLPEVNNRTYERVETPWGTYYAEAELLDGCVTAEDYAERLDLLPEELWNEAKDALEAQKLEHYEFNQSYYAQARDMSREEFESFVKENYAADLQTIADLGYSIKVTGCEGGYYVEEDGYWTILYGLRLVGEGKNLPLTLHISVRDGGLYIGAMSCLPQDHPAMDPSELLFFGYPSQ